MKLLNTWSRFGPLSALFCILATLLTPVAQAADWSSVGLYEQGTFYIDRDSLIREGTTRKVWTMLDYRQPQKNSQGKTYRSSRSLLAFDCDQQRVQTLSFSLHTGASLRGEVLTSEGVIREWQPVPVQTPIALIMANVCER